MGKDCDPWQLRNFNCFCNSGAPAFAKQNTNSMVFPSYADPYGLSHLNSVVMPPSKWPEFLTGQKRFIVFDKSGGQTNLIYSSVGSKLPYVYRNSSSSDLPVSNETDISNGDENEEMHEDTEEMDALLYSDSDNDYEEEEASTGHSPIETTGNFPIEEEGASSAVLQPILPPAKRRRFDAELDPSLADTASSMQCSGSHIENRKKAKMVKIQETVGVLRQIVPGGKGKDAVAVLDEAIRYLKSLRLKAKGVAATLK